MELSDLMEPCATLGADVERLVTIAEFVLEGVPIETFELGEYEILFVTGYTQRAWGLT